jgi:hypothetical protein
LTRKKKPEPPHRFDLSAGEVLRVVVALGSRNATVDDLVEALRAAPWEVRDEFDRKLRQRLTETAPAKPRPGNTKPPADIREACKTIGRWDDKSLRHFADHFRESDQSVLGMTADMCDEILRMRRDLRAVGLSTPYAEDKKHV